MAFSFKVFSNAHFPAEVFCVYISCSHSRLARIWFTVSYDLRQLLLLCLFAMLESVGIHKRCVLQQSPQTYTINIHHQSDLCILIFIFFFNFLTSYSIRDLQNPDQVMQVLRTEWTQNWCSLALSYFKALTNSKISAFGTSNIRNAGKELYHLSGSRWWC